MRILRNIFRRKLRAFLTIFGIAIGVFALVVMGSIAEKLTLLVDGGVKYYEGKVVIVPKVEGASQGASSLLSIDMQRDIERVHGVAAVAAEVSARLTTETITVSFGPPAAIAGSDGKGDALRDVQDHVLGGPRAAADRGRQGDRGVRPRQQARRQGGRVGQDPRQVLRGRRNRRQDADRAGHLGLHDAADAQKIAAEDLPDVLKNSVNPATLVSDFAVYPEPGQQPDVIAAAIKRKVDGVDAYTSREFEQQIKAPLQIFTTIIYAIGAISLLVGGLSVINTMTMSVAERTREIGIRKAIGASDGQIMRQFILESGGHRAARRARRAGARAAGRRGGQRRGGGERAGALPGDDAADGGLGGVRGRARRGQRPVPGVACRAPEPGGGVAL